MKNRDFLIQQKKSFLGMITYWSTIFKADNLAAIEKYEEEKLHTRIIN